jgi:Bacterial DNA-binding protein
MLKSHLVQRIAAQNPHLYQRDIEKIVNAIFDEIVDALRRGDRRSTVSYPRGYEAHAVVNVLHRSDDPNDSSSDQCKTASRFTSSVELIWKTLMSSCGD